MNRLQGKDLINIGIFTAIYFIVIFAAASIGFIPIFIPLISVIVPLVGGIPMMLFFSKIKKFGMLTICGLLLENGWTWVTALCVLVFTLFHWPCSTTCWTIWRETKSLKWTALSMALPTGCGLLLCFLISSAARLLGWWLL